MKNETLDLKDEAAELKKEAYVIIHSDSNKAYITIETNLKEGASVANMK